MLCEIASCVRPMVLTWVRAVKAMLKPNGIIDGMRAELKILAKEEADHEDPTRLLTAD